MLFKSNGKQISTFYWHRRIWGTRDAPPASSAFFSFSRRFWQNNRLAPRWCLSTQSVSFTEKCFHFLWLTRNQFEYKKVFWTGFILWYGKPDLTNQRNSLSFWHHLISWVHSAYANVPGPFMWKINPIAHKTVFIQKSINQKIYLTSEISLTITRRSCCKILIDNVYYRPQRKVMISQASVILSIIGLMASRSLLILVAVRSVWIFDTFGIHSEFVSWKSQ